MGRETDAASAVQIAIDRARVVGHGACTHEELDRLAGELRGHITQLLPVAQARADRLWRGSREWYVLAARLNSISTEVEEPLAASRLAAHVQVRLLALDCAWLLTRYDADLPEQEPAR
ncbi:DUF6415 family natural product biosynthesis protein [Streptomyces sp. NPDC057617]|uniref:DUF6415 family natural product biosynthesis protein n=1 Tax=Streptomyces sp. NPDC057617 TaxID=3346184 RepID=UPI003691DB3D